MQKQTKNNPITHLHYHYHYYYPHHQLASPNKNTDEPLSKSVIYERKRQDSFELTPQAEKFKLNVQSCQTSSSQKWPKMRSSEILNNKSPDQQQYQEQFSNLKVRYVVEEQLQQNSQEKLSNKNTSLSELEKSKTTVLGKQSVQNNLVAYYESEVRKYRSQIERLKMIQEECVYLRNTFYNHYDEKCNRK